MRLKGKVALVTGGSRGMGRAIARRFAGEGARVAIVYQRGQESADELIGEITEAGGEALAIQADVRSAEAADKAVQEVLEKWERIDILVNNAGVVRDTLFVSMEPSEWQEGVETNLGGAEGRVHPPAGGVGVGAGEPKNHGQRDRAGDDRDRDERGGADAGGG